jgi:hypothetical protein
MTAKSTALVTLALLSATLPLASPVALAATPSDACALLTQEEVAAALGTPVDAGERLMPNEPRFCTWHEHGGKQARNVRVDFISEQQYQIGKTAIPSIVKTPESGLGDDAYFSKAKGMVFNLSIKKGGSYFRVMARSNAEAFAKSNDAALDEKDKEVDRAIARAILKKL